MSVECLDIDHRQALLHSVQHVLATEVAEETMAQLLDGIPTYRVAKDARIDVMYSGHPLEYHQEICPGLVSEFREYREAVDLQSLYFDSRAIQAFQREAIGSCGFHMRLIELTAASIHGIAVALFRQQPKAHSREYITHVNNWLKPEHWVDTKSGRYWEESTLGPKPTHFFHGRYSDHDIYPNGVADIAAYWAEDRIFGGVVVFNRGQSGTECLEVFLHSAGKYAPIWIWRPTSLQFDAWIKLLVKGKTTDVQPLPLVATDDNNYRIHQWDAIALQHIFRDPWERRIPAQKPEIGDVSDHERQFQGGPADNYPPEVWQDTEAAPWIFEMGGHKGQPLGLKNIELGPPGKRRRRQLLEALELSAQSP